MLQKVLQAILRRYFGEFLTGLENVELAFWTGRINIQNASFKHDKINQLIKTHNLPFSIKFSYIGSLQIDIPWNKLSSAPVQLIISDIFIVLKLQNIAIGDMNEVRDDLTQNSKFLFIKKYVEYMIKKSMEMKVENNESGYLNRLVVKILHNMNIKINNISFRIQNEGFINKQVYVKKDNEEQQMQEFEDVQDKEDERKQRKLSAISQASSRKRRSSSKISVSQKPFALGFCIAEFIAFTIDEHGQRKFINVQTQNVKFSKMIELHEISLYWQQVMEHNLYTKTNEQRVQFLKSLIDRKEYRLLTIDGNVLLKKNHEQNMVASEGLEASRQYAYYLSSQFKELSIEANYEQIKQMLLIVQTIKTQSEKVSILKLKQLDQKEQLLLQNQFKQLFQTHLYPKNFVIDNPKNQKPSKQLLQIKSIFNGVNKKLLIKWTKETLIELIKKEKQHLRLKQKNKKGWFSFFSTQQDEIKLDDEDFKLIELQIKSLIALTQQKELTSFIKNLEIDQLTLKIKYQSKAYKNPTSQQVSLWFDRIHVRFMNYEHDSRLSVNVKTIELAYVDFLTNQRVQILHVKEKSFEGQTFLSNIGQTEFYDMEDQELRMPVEQNFALKLNWHKIKGQVDRQKVDLKMQPMRFKHEIKVLSFVSHMLKLRHDNQQMKSDLIIFKARVQNSIPEQEIQLKDTIYDISIEIKRISVLIELNENSFLKMYIDNITMDTVDTQIKNKHRIRLTNFGLKYIKKPLKDDIQLIRKPTQQSQIVNDFSVQITMRGIKKVQCQISEVKIIICEDQMNCIYSCLVNQAGIFTAQKRQYQKEKTVQHVFLEGKVSIINAFRVKYEYLAVLYADSISLYSLRKGIENLEQLMLNSDYVSPWQTIPIVRLKAGKKSKNELKLESLFVNEILQIENEEELDSWISAIEERIFDFRARSEMHKLVEEEERAMLSEENESEEQSARKETLKMIYKYESQIVFRAERIEILYCNNSSQPFIRVDMRELEVILEENNFTFNRLIKLMGIQVIDEQIPEQVPFRKFLSNLIPKNQLSNEQQMNLDQQDPSKNHSNPILVTLSGKKKLHPNYTGELEINVHIKHLLVNFNAELIFTIIDKMTFQNPVYVLTPEERDRYVLQYFLNVFDSEETRELEEKILLSEEILDSSTYIDVGKFRQAFTCIVLLKMVLKIESLQMNMIQGRTMHVPFSARLDQTDVSIDKGGNFFFIKAAVDSIKVDDLTGYPNTNTQAWQVKQKLTLIQTLPQKLRTCSHSVEFYYSSFPTETIINKNRFRSFTHIVANDLEIVYQNQPLMRFIDYLTNQLILFFMEPPYLHRFDQKPRGEFKYGQFYFTKEEIEEYVRNIAVPFFNELKIHVSNLVMLLNTWPGRDAIKFHIEKVKIYPENRVEPKRISFNVGQLLAWQNRHDEFNRLCEMTEFQGGILKSHWSNRLIIKAIGMSSSIFKQKFDYEMYHERCLHQEKEFLLPCIKLNKDMVEEAIIRNLTLVAPKPIYNLINKTFMFNMSYDDELDCQYITNFEHQKKVPIVELLYKIKIVEFTLLIPEVNETIVLIEDMVYKWVRYPDNLKEMGVTGRAIHILGNKNFIVPMNSKEQKALQYAIELKQDGNKTMSTFFRNCEIIYDWQLFSQLLGYFLLDDSCYAPQKTYPDLPLINCHFYFLDSFIRLSKTETHYYSLHGDITFSWIRMKVPHPETYKEDRKKFPLGRLNSLYLAKIKDCSLKKFEKHAYEKYFFNNFRALSLPIGLDMKWSNIMKISPAGVSYMDWIVQYDIKTLFLKLSYVDIEDLKQGFVKEPSANQPPPPQPAYTQYVQHIFNFDKLSLQLGVSELPVPLLDVTFEGKVIIQLLDRSTSINLDINNLTSKYWNMLIGRWEPILQKMTATSSLKFSKTGVYVIFDSPSIIYLDVSMDSLKVIKLISDDFAKKGKGVLNLAKKNMVADEMRISPYVITNRTSLTIHVSNQGKAPTSIPNNQKLHLQTNFLQDTNKMMGTIFVRIENEIKFYEIDLNMSSIVRTRVRYKEIDYDLYFQPISSPVVKEIIITSPYVLSNRTSHKVVVMLHNKEYFLNPDQKQAIPFYEIIQNKQFRIEFPHLDKPLENYPFTFKDIEKGYEHYINLEGQQFNCTLSVKDDMGNNSREQERFIEIEIAPVYYFKNMLPVDIVIQFNIKINKSNRLVTLQLAVNQQKQIYEINTIQDIMCRVQMKGFHFSAFVPLSKIDDKSYSPQEIILHDHRALDGKIKLKSIQQGKMRKVYLYSQAILINQTSHNLFTFSQNQLLAGQMVSQIPESSTKYLMIDTNRDKLLNFGFQEDTPYISNQFPTAQLGNQELNMIKSDQFFQLTLNNTLECLSAQAEIYCNVLKVMPKFILINSTSRLLQLKQQNTQKVTHLMPTERINWIWSNANLQKLLSFKPIDNQIESQIMNQKDWDFSAGFSIQTIEDTILVIRPFDKKCQEKLLLKIQVHKEYQQKFIVFKDLITEQLNKNSEDFLILQNDLKLARIQFNQNCFDSRQDTEHSVRPFKASPSERVLFGWQNAECPQEIKVKMEFLGALRPKFRTQTFTIDVKQKCIIEKVLENNNGDILQIQFVIETIGLKKKIKIRQKDLQESVLEMDMLGGGNKVGISLHELGISLINSGKNRCEVLYFSLKKFEIILMEQSQLRKIQVKIKYISIDNNSNHNTIYPVFFTPLKHDKTWTKSRPFFVMLIQTNLNKEGASQIKEFRMCLESISLKIHDEVLIKLYDMYKETGSSEKLDQNSDLEKIFRSYQTKFQWQQKEVKKLENQIFFRQFQIAKLSIEISFSLRPKINKGNYLIFTILSSFGMAISNISESQLTLSRFFKRQVTLTQLKNEMSEFYIKQFIKGIYKILGSFTIFGNPYMFVRLIAEGAWEMVNQPTEGFIKGPVEGTIGIGKGGLFFTRNVIAGTFNSFEAISESLSRGISYMTLDQKFIERRQKIKQQKSSHVIEGFKNGLFAFYTGFEVAFSGLYRLPTEGYRSHGFGAGVTGVLKGVTGLVTKPISGMFEGVSKISEGIKNTALLLQDGPNTKRFRYPRVFFSNQKYYTNYNHLQSYTIAFLEHLSTKYLNIDILFISMTENIQQNIMKSLVLTSKQMLIVNLLERNVETEIVLQDIKTVELADENIVRIITKYDEEDQIEIQEQPHKCQELIQAFKMSKQFF